MHNLKRIALIIVWTLVVLVIFSTSRDDSSHGQKAHSDGYERLLRKSGIIGFSQPPVAPNFTLQDLNGNSVSLSHFRGKVVFVNFWATWCPPCRHEMPSMATLYDRFKRQGLIMLAVDMRENRGPVVKFMKDLRLNFPALLDIDGKVSTLYRITGLPTTYIIDPGGRIIGKKVGPKDWATRDVMALFASLLKHGDVQGSAVVSTTAIPLPSVLLVKSSEASVYAQQDQSSETVARLIRGQKLTPLAKAFGAGSPWYMVKTQKGAVGWIKASDVEEASKKER